MTGLFSGNFGKDSKANGIYSKKRCSNSVLPLKRLLSEFSLTQADMNDLIFSQKIVLLIVVLLW